MEPYLDEDEVLPEPSKDEEKPETVEETEVQIDLCEENAT